MPGTQTEKEDEEQHLMKMPNLIIFGLLKIKPLTLMIERKAHIHQSLCRRKVIAVVAFEQDDRKVCNK